MWIIAINGEGIIAAQGALGEFNCHQTTRGKPKINISLCRINIYQRTYLEEICYRFYQVRPVVLHLEGHLPKKPLTPKNIGEVIKGTHQQLWKEALFVKYDKKKISDFFRLLYQSNNSLKEQKSSVQSFL